MHYAHWGLTRVFEAYLEDYLIVRSAVTGFEATTGNPTRKCAFEGNILSGLDCISSLNLLNITFAVEAL